MVNLAVLGSTKGSDLQAVIDAIKAGELPNINLKVVISNKPEAFILERAEIAEIETRALPSKGIKDREEYDKKLMAILDEYKIDLILLLGWMRILSKPFVKKYENRMMNIHPSLLPKYAGGMDLNVHEEVLKNHETESGCTLHYVTEIPDSGPIIKQKKVAIVKGETPDRLKAKVQAAEQEIIVEALKEYKK
ncbi:MAG: phosphoribosylglycinamide formyltransferase [Patescibacteria group bacterium]|jgi:formyltetrahydrofolate-dependent phosphoribosylglycinamide formyltransferase